MKEIKNYLLLAAFAGILVFTSCGDDDGSIPQTSATVTIDGKVYNKASDNEIAYIEFSFNDESGYSVGGDVVNGTDTVNFSISLPNISIATYTKAANGDDVRLSISSETFNMSTDGPFFSDEEDLTDFTIQITEKTETTITGEFTATVQDSCEETKAVSGEFVAVDFAVLFEGLFN